MKNRQNYLINWFKQQRLIFKVIFIIVSIPYFFVFAVLFWRVLVLITLQEFLITLAISFCLIVVIILFIILVPPDKWEDIRFYVIGVGVFIVCFLICVTAWFIGTAIGQFLQGCTT